MQENQSSVEDDADKESSSNRNNDNDEVFERNNSAFDDNDDENGSSWCNMSESAYMTSKANEKQVLGDTQHQWHLSLEKEWITQDPWFHLSTTISSMHVVDAYQL